MRGCFGQNINCETDSFGLYVISESRDVPWFRNPKLSLILNAILASELIKRQALAEPVAECQQSVGQFICHFSLDVFHLPIRSVMGQPPTGVSHGEGPQKFT